MERPQESIFQKIYFWLYYFIPGFIFKITKETSLCVSQSKMVSFTFLPDWQEGHEAFQEAEGHRRLYHSFPIYFKYWSWFVGG